MEPAHELAVHARLSGCAAVTVILILIVDRMGNGRDAGTDSRRAVRQGRSGD